MSFNNSARPISVTFYRQNQTNSGCAFAFQISFKEIEKSKNYKERVCMMFMETAKQIGKNENGNAQYDWANKITMKLGVVDVSEIASVLAGRKGSVGTTGKLFHNTPGGGTKILDVKYTDKGYEFSLSAQDANKTTTKAYIVLNHAEAELLCTMLRQSMILMHNWEAPSTIIHQTED